MTETFFFLVNYPFKPDLEGVWQYVIYYYGPYM